MSRTIPAVFRAASLAAQTNEVVLTFLDIVHGVSTIRVVNDLQSITRDGQVYSPFAFSVTFPPDRDGNIGEASLSIDAVDRSIVTALRNATQPIAVTVRVALASDPDATEVEFGTFEWRDISYNKTTVTGTLVYGDVLDNLVPAVSFTPWNVPGIF